MRSNFSKVLAITAVNQRRSVGDRRVLFVAVALPIMLILVIGFVGGRDIKAPLGVVVNGHGPFETRLVQLLEASPSVSVHFESSYSAERDGVLRGTLLGALVVPNSFESDVRSGKPVELQIFSRAGNSGAYLTQVATSAAYDVLVSEWNVARTVASPSGTSADAAFESITKKTDASYSRADAKFENGLPGPYSYTTLANLVLFVFLTLLVTSSGIVETRRNGLLRRMLASPTRPGVLVVGQLISATVLGLAQGFGLLIVGRLVFGVRWGDPIGVLILVIVLALAAGGAHILLGTLARSQEQAVALGIVIAIAFGMLGGCMWELSNVGPLMRTVGHIAPQAWAIDGFVRLVFNHSGLSGILPDVGVLALFAFGLVVLGVMRLRAVATADGAAY